MTSRKAAGKLSLLSTKPSLGPLETQIMEIIWKQDEVTIRVVYDALRQKRDLAYTTVMTVVHNLHRKGLLSQRMDGKTHYYAATESQSQFIRSRVGELLDILLEHFTEPAVAHLVERLSEVDFAQLTELEHTLAERRKEQTGGKNVH